MIPTKAFALLLAGAFLSACSGQGPGGSATSAMQAQRQNAPEKTAASRPAAQASSEGFDYYVLAMSWSPQHCSTRGSNDPIQCAGERLYDFVLHGLWPQYEKGWPSDCSTEPVSGRIVDSMLDIMPSKALVRHEWKKHGTCSGMEPQAYFAKAREAFQSVRIPSPYTQPKVQVVSSPSEVRSRFAKENPAFPKDGFAAVCSGRFLQEVRACLTKDFKPRACSAEVLRSQCRTDDIILRPVR